MANWLDEIIHQRSELESPLNFWRWSALAALSAVLKDNVWMDRYLYKLYPNIYVMLHGESGIKKGPPVAMAKRLATMVGNTKVITGRSSVQGILKDMGSGQSSPGGKVSTKSYAFVCSSELTSSIVDDPVATKILTDLYDRNYNEGEWKSLLKSETFKLEDPTVTMLTATNEAMAEDFFQKSAIQGGFFARTFIIYETKRNKRNSLGYRPRNMPDEKKSAEYLKEIAKLRGPFQEWASEIQDELYTEMRMVDEDRTMYFTPAGAMYEDWYEKFLNAIDSQEIKDETGTMNRFGDSVLKIAMLLSLAERPILSVTESAMSEAILICERLLGNVRKTTMGKQGLSVTSTLKTLILNELLTRENNQVTRQALAKKMFMHYGEIQELDAVMQSFEASGLITISTAPENQVVFKMPDEQVKRLKEFLAGRNRQ